MYARGIIHLLLREACQDEERFGSRDRYSSLRNELQTAQEIVSMILPTLEDTPHTATTTDIEVELRTINEIIAETSQLCNMVIQYKRTIHNDPLRDTEWILAYGVKKILPTAKAIQESPLSNGIPKGYTEEYLVDFFARIKVIKVLIPLILSALRRFLDDTECPEDAHELTKSQSQKRQELLQWMIERLQRLEDCLNGKNE